MSSIGECYVALSIFQMFQTLVTIGLVRQFKMLHKSANENAILRKRLEQGTQAPEFLLTDLRSGRQRGLELMREGGGVLLFLSPGCSFCLDIVRRLRKIPVEQLVRLIPVCLGSDAECKRLLNRLPPQLPLLLDGSRGVSRLYGISSVPGAVAVTQSCRIQAYSNPLSADDISNFLSSPEVNSTGASAVGETFAYGSTAGG